jgi:hypothetical protein
LLIFDVQVGEVGSEAKRAYERRDPGQYGLG